MSWKRHKAKCALLEWFDQTDAEKFVSEHKGIQFRESDSDVKVELLSHKEPAMSEFKECTACNGRGEVGNILDGDICQHCKGSGVEREMLGLPVPVGSLQELHPEFAKVLHENFLELLGDDSHIENHISPHCQSRDV